MIQGTNQRFQFTFTDDSGRLDLTGATIHYRWKRNQYDEDPPEISLSSAVITEIEILTQLGPTLGQCNVFLIPGDTDTLPVGWHYWDIWAVLASGKRYAKAAERIFLTDAVTDL